MAKKVVLDPGHGGKDPGALGNGLKEKDIVLSIALKTGEILKRHGVEVVYTRDTDKFIQLAERANIANRAKADALISFHVNSALNPKATGLEVWTSKGQTAGDKLATAIGEQLIKDFPNIAFRKDMSDGDLDKEENFVVLARSNMAACLVEYMFIVNPLDAQILRTKQNEFAESTARGILKYLGITYKEVINVTKPTFPTQMPINSNVPSAWAIEAWNWAKKEGLLDGNRPKDAITREEISVILKRLADRKLI